MTKIAFQGKPGAYSDLACRQAFPDVETLPCPSFVKAFRALENGDADLAMIPIDNSIAGRVADIHQLLPESKLHIIAEHFVPVHHCLLAPKGTDKADIKEVYSHIHALPQCSKKIQELGAEPVIYGDTASSAEHIAELGDTSKAAIASELAAEIYGLDILERHVQNADHNTTRFIVLSRDMEMPALDEDKTYVTSFIFRVRNIPAALYKALGGFATNGINMTKLESYLVDGHFTAAQFYCDVEGHPDDRNLRLALEELEFFAKKFHFLGTYPAADFRLEEKQR